MSWRSEGDRDENQRPALIASRSSIVRIGSSMVCRLGDWRACPLSRQRRPAPIRVVACATGASSLVLRRLLGQEGGNAGAGVPVVQVADEMVALGGELPVEAGIGGVVHQLLDAGQ